MVERNTLQRSVIDWFKGCFKAGAMFVIPALITVGLLIFGFRFLSGFLQPLPGFVEASTGIGTPLSELLGLLVIAGVIFVLGVVIRTVPHGVEAADFFHSGMERIPGVGSVYSGFREMSETIATGGESFRDVKLVEYPTEGSYSMAFVTADAPEHFENQVGHAQEGMISLFLPMGPNPVMGGFVIYVSRNRIYDIDISVEEGLQAVITSGVTVGEPEGPGGDEHPQRPLQDA